MQRFCELLRAGAAAHGADVDVVRPAAYFARLAPRQGGLVKWLGYLDKYLVFPVVLLLRAGRCDVAHICDHSNSMYTRFLRGKPHVVTCHDLIAVRGALGEIPRHPVGWSGRLLQGSILRGLRRAQMVACVSEHTRAAVLRLAGRSEALTPCIPNGLNYAYRPMERDEARSRVARLLGESAPGPFLLHVGGNQWYKNRPGALEIFARLRSREGFSGHRLILAGKPFTDELRGLARSLGLSGSVVELVAAPNEDLRALYSLAEGLLFPSLEEGFGWPIVEAQACGWPGVATGQPPMTEVGGSAAVYFDPDDPQAAAEAIAAALADRPRLVESGFANASRFGSEAMLRAYMDLYHRLAGGSE